MHTRTQGPEYDPSVDFMRPTSVNRRPPSYGEPSFDPSEASHASFDVEMYAAAPSQRDSAAMSARPRSVWGATVAVTLQQSAGRFLVEEVRQKSQGKLAIGDEILKIDGLQLHGKTLEEAEEILAGPDGSMVELEVRTVKESISVVEVLRERRVMAWQDIEAMNSNGQETTSPAKNVGGGGGGGEREQQNTAANNRIIEDAVKRCVCVFLCLCACTSGDLAWCVGMFFVFLWHPYAQRNKT
jgi:hypothetical protein